jgi:precorrin-6B methylase 2
MFFERISVKFRPRSAKKLIDFLYVIFEKVASKFDIISSNYFKMYQELVDKEIKMAEISKNDKVVVIGCGALPITAILVSLKTKAHVVAIDKDKRAVKEAYNYIKNHHLESSIEIQYADGNVYPLKKFDVIYLTYGLKKKEDIFNYIVNNSKNNSRVIFRTAIGSRGEKRKSITELSKWFLVKDSIKSDTMPPSGTYLLYNKVSK